MKCQTVEACIASCTALGYGGRSGCESSCLGIDAGAKVTTQVNGLEGCIAYGCPMPCGHY